VAQIKLKLAANKISSQRVTWKKFNIEKLNYGEIRKKFEEELKESLEQEKMQELDPAEHWTKIQDKMSSKGENVLGLRQRTNARDWISGETWSEINRRKITKQKINNADDKLRPILLAEYSEINKRVKRYARRDKRAWADKLAHKAQLAAEANILRELYQITKRLSGKPNTSQQAGVRDSTGRMLTTPQNQLTRWQEHFKENFAVPPQQISMSTIQRTHGIIKIPAGAPAKK